jgi:hypothetical protein
MLQVARLAPTQLCDSRDLVAQFLHSCLNPDGGFQDRAGTSDLYYTVFGIEGLVALQQEPPAEHIASYLTQFGDGAALDFVHLACLARCWAGLGRVSDSARQILQRIETFRSADGGYAVTPGADRGTVYACFLALGAYQDLRVELPDARRLIDCICALRSSDGGYANQPGGSVGITTTTAAAALLLRELEAPIDRQLGVWLLDRCGSAGGFFATPAAPVPDLLSTATALHALSVMHVPLGGIQEPCLDFIDSLWTNRGGFYGSWADDAIDCEYTYYALLSLGHLSLATPRQ